MGSLSQRSSADERAAFLDAACGGDVQLRREVESLLAQPTNDGFLYRRWRSSRR
jgi:hypothetical protein